MKNWRVLSGWLGLGRTAAVLAMAAGVWGQGAVAAEVRNVTAKYAWPWGVGIRYEVVGAFPANAHITVTVTATDRTSGAAYTADASALSGDMGTAEGQHRLVWDLDKQGVKLQSTNVVFTVAYEIPPPPLLYCVVDLSGGADAASYPVTYLYEPPGGGFNRDVYKTTKLVLRRIEPGTFTMGSSSDKTEHKVTLTKPYYIGLFEVTQKQWKLVTGSNPSKWKSDKRPVEQVSWNMIRGNGGWPSSSAVSADSFMGRLRARTGLGDFDLPTEAQWEYACRAGTTTAYSYGKYDSGDYMWYGPNSSNQTHDVGTKDANPWGLYDMHGNVGEWCLDWYTSNLGTAAATDPKGASSGESRVWRGGCWSANFVCSSASRYSSGPGGISISLGFRLSMILSE